MFSSLDRIPIYCQISRKYYGVWFWFSSTAPYTFLLVAAFVQFLNISANFGILTYSSSFLRQRHFVFLQKEDPEPGMDISLCGASRSATVTVIMIAESIQARQQDIQYVRAVYTGHRVG